MYTRFKSLAGMALMLSLFSAGIGADNRYPIIQTNYTADPAPMVYNDTVFLYTSHDEDDADNFKMIDWLLYTSTDMVNWTDHGAVASLENFKWRSRDNGAWAIQVVERDGKFYMYCPLHGHGIGVLVADSPYGPFVDPIGKPLVWQQEHWDDIDPTVFIDDDGQAYMYWGNPTLYCVKLNEDMISYSGDIMKFPHINDYQEGPWFYKRDGWYYLAFASTCCPEGIGYAMSDSPLGPWEYKGHIMDHTPRTRGNHPGIADYKGRSYLFGQSYDVLRIETPDHHERRNVELAEMEYAPDGTIVEVPYWRDAHLAPAGTINPYGQVQAETMAWGYGLKTEKSGFRNMVVTDIDDGEYICVKNVDFGNNGPTTFSAMVKPTETGGRIEIGIDRVDGPVIGAVEVKPCVESPEMKAVECDVDKVTGIHDVYLRFVGRGKNLFLFDSWNMR